MDQPVRAANARKLIMDLAPLFEDHWTGIPVFTRRLIQALDICPSIELQFSFQLAQVPRALVLQAIHCGNGTALRCHFERNAGELYPVVDSDGYLLYPSVKETPGLSAKEASTIHDISTLVMPEFHEQPNIDYHMSKLRTQLQSDDVVFCASEATRAALTQYFPSVRDKTRLLPQYVDWPGHFERIERNLPKPFARPYVVVIGTVEPRKNLGLLLKALAHAKLRDRELDFVVLGKRGWKTGEMMAKLTVGQQERFKFLGFVNEFTKYRILRHAQFLVYPSLYEGFGIPALEAMSLGKPVLAAMTSSFPEIVGEAGLYFDPLSAAEFADAFEEMCLPGTLAELAPRALEQAAKYTRERFAQPVLDWLQSG